MRREEAPSAPDRRGNKEKSASPADPLVAVRSPGVGLDPASRAFFEPRFGHDLGEVRIHTAPSAVAASKSIGARAFTLGTDIVVGRPAFTPHSADGRSLLAHELAHVIQHSNGTSPGVGRSPRLAEVEATAASERIAAGHHFQVRTAAPTGVPLKQDAPTATQEPESARSAEPASGDQRFKGFPPVLQAGLQYAEDRALDVLDRMVVELLPWVATPATKIAFHKQFRTLDPDRILLVINILRKIRAKLPTVRYVYDNEGKCLAWTIPLVGPIYICPPFFEEKEVGFRYNTLIHEAAHRFAVRLDLGYAFNERYDDFGTLRQIWNAEPYGELAEDIGSQPEPTP